MKKKSIIAFICGILTFFVGCGVNGGVTEGYTYKKISNDRLYFYSSDKNLDTFLNDFYDRHSRANDETAINAMQLGEAGTAWKAWESRSLVWFDSTNTNFNKDSFATLRQWIYSAPVDDYGYCWSAMAFLEDATKTPQNQMFGMGWPFPNYDGVGYYDWEFNGFKAEDTDGWVVSTDGTLLLSKIGEGYFLNKVENATDISFTLGKISSGIPTAEIPYLEIDLRWCVDGLFTENDVDDIYVSWKVKGSDEWYTAKQSDYTARTVPITANYANHAYMPMYLHKNWGTTNRVTDIKVSVKAKSGKTLTGDFNLNFIRGNYDSRQLDNGYNLIEATKLYYEFTGDKKVLKDTLNRCRQIIMFMTYNMGGEYGLLDLSNFVGHNGGVIADGVSNTIASSYWDVLSLSPKSLYAQVLYYQSLQNLIYLEKSATLEGITLSNPSIKLTDGKRIEYDLTLDNLTVLANKVKNKVQQPVDKTAKTGFFDMEKGRFIEGFNMHGDVVDYGSTIFNNMVVSAGMATEYQAEQVVSWINGDRIVDGDDASGFLADSKKEMSYGIYDYEFAPRTTTVKNSVQYTSGHIYEANKEYSVSCQDGGAILFTSYYDILARLQTRGVEDAYQRLKGICDWYLKIYNYAKEKGYDGTAFYRGYYDNETEHLLQGMGSAGSLGLDSEFLENAILYSVVPFGFFNLESVGIKNLSINPNLPKELKFWRMENLMYNGVRYDLEAGKDYVILESVRGNSSGMKLTVNLKTNSETPKVYVNGKLIDSTKYTVNNGYVTLTVDFRAQKIQIK